MGNEQTVDSRDTECLLELINLFHDYNQTLPKRVYDQDIIAVKGKKLTYIETNLNLNKTNCIFSIGFYSNNFLNWVLVNQAKDLIEYTENPYQFRLKYFNPKLQKPCWTDYYAGNDIFDCGFLLKLPVKFKTETINCYFFCGIENRATKAITSYLCQNWKTIQSKQDFERDIPINDSPFVMVFKVSKSNLMECYCEKVIKLDF